MAIRPTRIEKQLKAPPVKSIQQQKVCDELYFTAACLQVVFHLPQLFPLAEIQLSMFLITGYPAALQSLHSYSAMLFLCLELLNRM